MRIIRDTPFGHVGYSPQNQAATLDARVDGIEQQFADTLEPNPRIDAYMPLPPPGLAAIPGAFRDSTTQEHIDDAIQQANTWPTRPDTKQATLEDVFGD